ncbi:MAG: acyl-CoA thioesterase/bile acid-CoA:amino acid N-acyltransferase family protein [Pseudomonadota bacterium]
MIRVVFKASEALALVALFAISSLATAADLKLHVAPLERLMTEPSSVVVAGAPAGAEVVIEATLTDGTGQAWSSQGVYFADHKGEVDTSTAASLGGTYQGIDHEAIFWSMQPASIEALRDAAKSSNPISVDSPRRMADFDSFMATHESRKEPVQISFQARVAGILADSHKETATAAQTVHFTAEGVKRTEISEGDIRGVLYEAPGDGPHPLAVVITGSSGGVAESKASLLASHGITSFALGFFRYKDLPQDHHNIDLEYFSEGMQWLAERYGQKRVALLGASRGGEGSLIIASTFPDQVSAVIPGVPTNMVFSGFELATLKSVPGWLLNGEPLPYIGFENYNVRPSDLWSGSGEVLHNFRPHIVGHDFSDPRWIQVENIKSPILLITGDSDAMWSASIASERILERLKHKNFKYPAEHLKYVGAGHLVTMPMLIKSRADRTEQNEYGYAISIGGNAPQNAHAQTDAFNKTVEFIRLYESPQD